MENNADLIPQASNRELADIRAIQQDAAFLDLVKAGNQAHESGLPRAGGSDYGDHLACGGIERDVLKSFGPIGVVEVHAIKRDSPARTLKNRRAGHIPDLGFGFQQGEGHFEGNEHFL